MYHDYPYTTYYSDVDKLCGACRACGLRLVVQGDYLRLVDKNGNVISNVQVSFAEKTLTDVDGRPIKTYLVSASENGTSLVFAHADGTYDTVNVPLATRAAKDLQNKDLLDYVFTVSPSGDKLKITKGDGTNVEITVPFATSASVDSSNKDITTYAATIEVDGDELVLRDSKGRQLSRITVPYATEAAHAITAEDADNAQSAAHATEADEADHALDADTADFATLATDATNAIESVTITGDQITFTTFGGTQYARTIPYSLKALNDDLSNKISTTYVASVTNDINTGKLQFWNASGALIAELLPTVSKATYDSYDNLIADYVKTIVVDNQSDYVTVTKGTGSSSTLKINYSEHAYMDTNNQVIKNYYISWLTCEEDIEDGHWKLVMWNGDIPRAEIGRFEVYAYAAQCDVNGKELTTYIADVDINANNNPIFLDGEGNEVAGISGSVTSTPAGTVSASASGTAVTLTSGTLPSCTYTANTKTITFNPGTFPAINSVTDPTVTATFTGTAGTAPVVFAQ